MTQLWGFSPRAQLKCWHFINLLLPYCLGCVLWFFCLPLSCVYPFANGLLMGCRGLWLPSSPFGLLALCAAPLFCWLISFPLGRQTRFLAFVGEMKGGLRDGYWTLHGKEVGCYSPIQSPSQFSSSPSYIYWFSQRHHWQVQSASRNKEKSTSRSAPTKMLMSVEKENKRTISCTIGSNYNSDVKLISLHAFINLLTDWPLKCENAK